MTAVQESARRRLSWDHPELALAGICGCAWLGLMAFHFASAAPATPHGHHHAAPTQDVAAVSTGIVVSVTFWILMAVATMLPTALPAARTIGLTGMWSRRHRGPALFAAGYLAVWIAAGIPLVVAAAWIVPGDPSPLLIAAALAVAAAWEITPWKRWCLRGCHRLRSLPPSGRRADHGCVALGVRNGLSCTGACWAMMTPMALAWHAAGLWVMTVVTATVWAEKLLRNGSRHLPMAAATLAASAVLVAVTG
ncbi:DUF2182 domain-containing protein [Rhodococcus sp. NPDC003318]|uniref:copper chaperone n=1 Tax=Rhodococcus sp. NPDC003318 TaxID=3364503 RepID=UPI00369DC84D